MELWEQPVEVRISSAQGHVQQKIAQLATRSRSNQDSHQHGN